MFYGVLDGFWSSRAPGDPSGTPHWGPFGPKMPTKWPRWDPKTAQKRDFSRNFFCSQSVPEGSQMVPRPQAPLKTCLCLGIRPALAHFPHKMGHFWVQKRVFLEKNFRPKSLLEGSCMVFRPPDPLETYFGPHFTPQNGHFAHQKGSKMT